MRAKLTTRLVQQISPQTSVYEIWDTDLAGFVLRVWPSGQASYYLVYRTLGGKKVRYRIGQMAALTVVQARDLARQYAARATTGEDLQATKEKARAEVERARFQTLGGFLDHKYGPWLLGERPEKRHGPETLKRLHANFADLLERPLADITPWIVEKWRAEERKRGKAASTINRDVTTLRSLLSKAVTWQVIDAHPLAPVKPLKVDEQGVIRYLSPEEEARLRSAISQRDTASRDARTSANAWRAARGYPLLPSLDAQPFADRLTPLVIVSLHTGLRRGEAFNLHWQDVDLSHKRLTVRGTQAKSKQTRYVPLNAEAVGVLTAWRDQSSGDGYVFPADDGGRLDNTRKSWARLLKMADITDFRWHDLRHTFASKLVMAGVSLAVVRELLGHASLSMTLRYSHLAPDHIAAAVERLCPIDLPVLPHLTRARA